VLMPQSNCAGVVSVVFFFFLLPGYDFLGILSYIFSTISLETHSQVLFVQKKFIYANYYGVDFAVAVSILNLIWNIIPKKFPRFQKRWSFKKKTIQSVQHCPPVTEIAIPAQKYI
jgi:hypothetical protein